jgi:hypothetical protein
MSWRPLFSPPHWLSNSPTTSRAKCGQRNQRPGRSTRSARAVRCSRRKLATRVAPKRSGAAFEPLRRHGTAQFRAANSAADSVRLLVAHAELCSAVFARHRCLGRPHHRAENRARRHDTYLTLPRLPRCSNLRKSRPPAQSVSRQNSLMRAQVRRGQKVMPPRPAKCLRWPWTCPPPSDPGAELPSWIRGTNVEIARLTHPGDRGSGCVREGRQVGGTTGRRVIAKRRPRRGTPPLPPQKCLPG